MSDDFPKRQTIRLPEYDYSSNGLYFVTICTQNQENLFGKINNGTMELNNYGRIVETEITNTAKIRDNIQIDEYIIMPNHIHLIIQIVGATRWVARNPDNTNPDNTNPDNTNPDTTNPDTTNTNNGLNKPTLKSCSIGAIIGQIKSISTKKSRSININGNIDDCDKKGCINDNVGHGVDVGHGDNVGHGADVRQGDNVGHGFDFGHGADVRQGDNVGHGVDVRQGDNVGHGVDVGHGVGRPTGSPLRWQRNYYEHIIRNEKSYETIVEYIKTNPAKWQTDKFFRE